MSRTVYIDGDILTYRCGFACEHKRYDALIDGQPMVFESKTDLNNYVKENAPTEVEYTSELLVEPVEYALSTVKHMLANIQTATKAGVRYVFLSDPDGNFRKDVATIAKYKGNRDQLRKPLHADKILEYLREIHGAVSLPNLEADDLLADAQTSALKAGWDTVIASIDKDLLQIPGKHFNFVDGTKLLISPQAALKHKMQQMLTGDTTDNIPGIRGIGPAKAEKALKDCETAEDMQGVVYDMWTAYLAGDSKPDWLTSFFPETGDLTYTDWNGNERMSTLSDILNEIERLITVGVPTGWTQEESKLKSITG